MRKLFSLENRVWSASILNVGAMALQLWTLWRSQTTAGLSISMVILFLYMQITYAEVGYHAKSWALFWGMVASALLSVAILVVALMIRFGPGQLS